MWNFPIKNGEITMLTQPNIEYANPIAIDMDMHYETNRNMVYSAGKLTKETNKDTLDKIVINEFNEDWNSHLKTIMEIRFPDDLFYFLTCRKKKKQEELLKKFKFSMDSLQALFYKAYEEYGFLYSFYRFERKPRNFENRVHPELAYLQEDGSILKSGNTDLSDGELKSIIQQRNVVIAKFLDNGNLWHCFLHTQRGLMGEETGNTPHIHYISSAFGKNITRQKVLKQLQKGKYELPSMLHINFETGLEKFSHMKPPIF